MKRFAILALGALMLGLPATAPVSAITSRTTSKIRCGRSLAASRRRQ